MSKRVSLEEKRSRMLQIFYENKEFFTLKEIETIASKEKGIVLQTVKDVLQALVDDGLVRSDKIGSTIYFWAFPGENITTVENRIADANKKIVATEFKLQKLNEEIKKLQSEKNDTVELSKLLEEIEQFKQKEVELKQQIAKLSDADPEVIENMAKKAENYKEAANIWTDNIFAIQSWCKRKFDINESTLNKQFRIPDDLDYIN
ncbi:meiotic nuclear division protein 1 homolog [Chelonus insularis]|uniref:meiotic nuclear division protein 1 homolog n=1 Tax=Chelonus insularis TaxID=460826 RepID=UPI001589CAB7|nr:meiotic nuclear division protein 1 homolog [Chelonus insularis]XP_034948309.1 meiotic nuclear division protein 1 homolog [Chelonus insularis]